MKSDFSDGVKYSIPLTHTYKQEEFISLARRRLLAH